MSCFVVVVKCKWWEICFTYSQAHTHYTQGGKKHPSFSLMMVFHLTIKRKLFMKNIFHNKIDFNAIEMIAIIHIINHCIHINCVKLAHENQCNTCFSSMWNVKIINLMRFLVHYVLYVCCVFVCVFPTRWNVLQTFIEWMEMWSACTSDRCYMEKKNITHTTIRYILLYVERERERASDYSSS